MSEFDKYLQRLVAGYQQSRKIAIVVAGGGASMSHLALVPGSSKVLDAMHVLYSEPSTVAFIRSAGYSIAAPDEYKMVSPYIANALFLAGAHHYRNSGIISVTSALTTNRYRRGDNHAIIRTSNSVCHELKFDKLPESVYTDPVIPWRDQQIALKRQKEDELISEVALKLGTGFEAGSLERLYSNGTLRRL